MRRTSIKAQVTSLQNVSLVTKKKRYILEITKRWVTPTWAASRRFSNFWIYFWDLVKSTSSFLTSVLASAFLESLSKVLFVFSLSSQNNFFEDFYFSGSPMELLGEVFSTFTTLLQSYPGLSLGSSLVIAGASSIISTEEDLSSVESKESFLEVDELPDELLLLSPNWDLWLLDLVLVELSEDPDRELGLLYILESPTLLDLLFLLDLRVLLEFLLLLGLLVLLCLLLWV